MNRRELFQTLTGMTIASNTLPSMAQTEGVKIPSAKLNYVIDHKFLYDNDDKVKFPCIKFELLNIDEVLGDKLNVFCNNNENKKLKFFKRHGLALVDKEHAIEVFDYKTAENVIAYGELSFKEIIALNIHKKIFNIFKLVSTTKNTKTIDRKWIFCHENNIQIDNFNYNFKIYRDSCLPIRVDNFYQINYKIVEDDMIQSHFIYSLCSTVEEEIKHRNNVENILMKNMITQWQKSMNKRFNYLLSPN